MIIKNGKVFVENGTFEKKNLEIKAGKISDIFDAEDGLHNAENQEVVDAEGMYVIPGLVDIHFHGAMGYDFCDGTKEAIEEIAKYQLSHGVTDIVPATMTLPKDVLRKVCRQVAKYLFDERKELPYEGSHLRGITLEGPFISQGKKGAQNKAYIEKPDIAFYKELQELSGNRILQVVVAPEEDNQLQFVDAVSQETVVSIGHTVADYDTAKKAFEKGATHVTHLLNGMNGFCHRQPGVVGAALDSKGVFVELICDGVHVHPSMVRAVFELFGAERICMISDSMRAAGMPEGCYSLGGQAVQVVGKQATLEDGTIAGSVANLYDCLKTAVLEMKIPLEEVVLACTKTPATSLGLEKECGILARGRNANLVILTPNLDIVYIFKNGQKV